MQIYKICSMPKKKNLKNRTYGNFFLLCQVAQKHLSNSCCKLLFVLQGITDSTLSVLTEYLMDKTRDREAVDPEVMKRAALISLCGWKSRFKNIYINFCLKLNNCIWGYYPCHFQHKFDLLHFQSR